jgi:DNA-binding CsgD family transcriptional regulator
MLVLAGPSPQPDGWHIVRDYCINHATAVLDPRLSIIDEPDEDEIARVTRQPLPLVFPFGLIARKMNTAAAVTLHRAGRSVQTYASIDDASPLTDLERAWFRRLILGDRIVDIAADFGYSERALYRAMRDLWSRLGVQNRTQAVALATKQGWV